MLKIRVIPILTFDGLSLVKTKQFTNPRTVGNPTQAARVYNSRNVDELVFVDIKATSQKRKINLNLVKKVIDECYMPVTIGGGINSLLKFTNRFEAESIPGASSKSSQRWVSIEFLHNTRSRKNN